MRVEGRFKEFARGEEGDGEGSVFQLEERYPREGEIAGKSWEVRGWWWFGGMSLHWECVREALAGGAWKIWSQREHLESYRSRSDSFMID